MEVDRRHSIPGHGRIREDKKLSRRVAGYTGAMEEVRRRVYTQVAQQMQEPRVEFPSQYLGEFFRCVQAHQTQVNVLLQRSQNVRPFESGEGVIWCRLSFWQAERQLQYRAANISSAHGLSQVCPGASAQAAGFLVCRCVACPADSVVSR